MYVTRSVKRGLKPSRNSSSRCASIVATLICLLCVAPKAALAQSDPEGDGEWAGPCDSSPAPDPPEQSIHAALTHLGQVITWTFNTQLNSLRRVHAWQFDASVDPCNPNSITSFAYPPKHSGWPGTSVDGDGHTCQFPSDPSLTHEIACAGQTFLANGDLLLVGGGEIGQTPTQIHGAVWRLNPSTLTFSEEQALHHGRYYPTPRLDAYGNVFAISGEECEPGAYPRLTIVHEFIRDTDLQGSAPWVQLPNGPNFDSDYPFINFLTWPSTLNGSLSLIGKLPDHNCVIRQHTNPVHYPNTFPGLEPKHFRLDFDINTPANSVWSEFADWPEPDFAAHMESATAVPLVYHAPGVTPPSDPASRELRNGSILVFGAGRKYETPYVRMWLAPLATDNQNLNSNGNGTWISSLDTGNPIPATTYARNEANAVILPNGRYLVIGGGIHRIGIDPCPCSCPTLTGAPDQYVQYYRSCAAVRPEMYDPVTGQVTVLAASPTQTPRLHHSEALLLPDGRIFVAGGEYKDVSNPPPPPTTYTQTTFEIFAPPYIFKPNRLSIVSAPTEFHYGYEAGFRVSGALTGDIRVLLIRPGSATHGRNFDQRAVQLKINCIGSASGGSTPIRVQVPAQSTGLLPPGYYMLWITKRDASGEDVPCVRAAFVQVTANLESTGEACTAGGCPFVWGWDGKEMRIANSILGQSERDALSDRWVKDVYQLPEWVKPDNERIVMEIREDEEEVSYIKSARLMYIDTDANAELIVGSNGNVAAYHQLTAPARSYMGTIDRSVEDLLENRDGRAVQGKMGERVVVEFARASAGSGPVIIRPFSKPNPNGGLRLEARRGAGWKLVDVITPREFAQDELASLEGVGTDAEEPLVLRLSWEGSHGVDFVGRAAGVPTAWTAEERSPSLARHSVLGDVRLQIERVDGRGVEVRRGQALRLEFPRIDTAVGKRQVLALVVEGRYFHEESGSSLPEILPPSALVLSDMRPNPAVADVRVAFATERAGRVTVTVFNVRGERVATVLDSQLQAGDHEAVWDGRTVTGQTAAAAVYVVQVKGFGQTLTRKVAHLR